MTPARVEPFFEKMQPRVELRIRSRSGEGGGRSSRHSEGDRGAGERASEQKKNEASLHTIPRPGAEPLHRERPPPATSSHTRVGRAWVMGDIEFRPGILHLSGGKRARTLTNTLSCRANRSGDTGPSWRGAKLCYTKRSQPSPQRSGLGPGPAGRTPAPATDGANGWEAQNTLLARTAP